MAATKGFSIKMWSGSGCSSSCLIFDRAPDSVVDSLLALLGHQEGLGQPSPGLLQVGGTAGTQHWMGFNGSQVFFFRRQSRLALGVLML